jgi:hypothetical protein
MIVIPSREDGGDGSRRFPFHHPMYLVCPLSYGEILHFVQRDNAFAAEGV